jgi:outer membrane lipoprotein SlyB
VNGDLLSVTQRDELPLALGQKVLVIAGNQARVVPDYTVPMEPPPKPAEAPPTTTGPAPPPVAAVPLAPPAAPDPPKAETTP